MTQRIEFISLPRTLAGRVIGGLLVAAALVVAIFFLTIFLLLAGVALLGLSLRALWRARHAPAPTAPEIIDGEYSVVAVETEEKRRPPITAP